MRIHHRMPSLLRPFLNPLYRFSSTARAATGVAPLPDTTENIHPGMVHDTYVSEQDELGKIDYVWGARIPPHPHVIHKSFYQKFDRAGGYPGNTSFPVYYDENWFRANHPDWLVYLCDRQTLAYEFGDPNVPLDITNPDVLQFMLQTWIYPALDRGYDGIAFDNVNLTNDFSEGRCGVFKRNSNGSQTWQYLYGDASSIHGTPYVNSIINWAKFMQQAIHNYKAGATMEINFSPHNGGDPSQSLAFNEQLLPYIDLAFSENAYTGGNDSFSMDDDWVLETQFGHDLAVQGKGQLISFGYRVADLTQEQRLWIIANYLLVKGKHTYTYIARNTNNGGEYGYLYLISEYYISIGHPLNDYYPCQYVYMRDFSNGKAIVNPSSTQSYSVSFTRSYQDVYGNSVGSGVTMDPHSGLVLLNS